MVASNKAHPNRRGPNPMPTYCHFFMGKKTEDMGTDLYFKTFKREVNPDLFYPIALREEATNKLCGEFFKDVIPKTVGLNAV
jgi:hypothetical protein